MTDTLAAFYTLHRDLPREGPGEAADVAWAAQAAGLKARAEIADVGCGPGGDVAALLQAAPQGHVTALDKTEHYVQAARALWQADPRVTVLQADMARIMNPYDMIWCAGAVYFLGITEALKMWRKSLRAGGAVAFSEPCWFTDNPSSEAQAVWAEYPQMTNAAGIAQRVTDAGFGVVATRKLSDAAWEAYYGPLEARIAALRPQADAALQTVLGEAEAEAAAWRKHRDSFGYLLTVARPR
ncbi:SAM-dependent methyltransferase [Sulfitobacter brevis]|uniref:SAM-dependent methyltransferase n=1 Tax=Sulfitobacter brevis TaxID=74348 RepID=A0A1I2CNM1_9RHOB|nr:class I SAM-dependent methyltransferase [Sulfitobacter brevis]SFE69834.1 SAM-dependent methyltransferase [Sulfitobacter brevis]